MQELRKELLCKCSGQKQTEQITLSDLHFKGLLAPLSGGFATCIFMCMHSQSHFLEQEIKMQSLTVQNFQLQHQSASSCHA